MSIALANKVKSLEQTVELILARDRERDVLIAELKGYISPLLVKKSLSKTAKAAEMTGAANAETQKVI